MLTNYLTLTHQSSSDLPLLVTLRDISRRLLTSFLPSSDVPYNNATETSSQSPRFNRQSVSELPSLPNDAFRIGFITPPFRDNKIPVTDHLHAHAYILPADLMGWWRAVGYSNLAWYDINDLIAEIRCVCSITALCVVLTTFHPCREETSNNRVRSGPMPRRAERPIDQVPSAGARQGLPNGVETTEAGLAVADLEDPESSPAVRPVSAQGSPSALRPQSPSTQDVVAPYAAGGGALLFSPTSDGIRTPTTASGLLSPKRIPPLSV